jgi:membrane-associated HD superfamily phosphohydrolase
MKTSIKKITRYLPFFKTANGMKEGSWIEKVKTPSFQKWAIAIGSTLILTLLLSPTLQLPPKEYKIGDIATKEVKSTQDLLVEDEKSTQEKRLEAERSVLSVYDYDPGVLRNAESQIRSTFETLAASIQKGEKGNDQIANRRKIWESSFPISLNQKEWLILEKDRFHPSIGETALGLLASLLKKGVVNDKGLLDPDSGKGITLRDIQTREERRSFPPFSFFDFKEARNKLRTQADLLSPTIERELAPIVLKIAEPFLKPNLTFNKDETEEKKKVEERGSIPSISRLRGEVIVRAGDRLGRKPSQDQGPEKAQESGYFVSILIRIGLLAFLTLSSLYHFSTKNIRKISLSIKDLLFVSSVLLGLLALLKLFLATTEILGGEFLSIPSSSYLYLFPIVTGAMIVRIVIHSEVAIFFAILSSYFSAAMIGNQLSSFIFYFVGSVVGAHLVAHCEQRTSSSRQGFPWEE